MRNATHNVPSRRSRLAKSPPVSAGSSTPPPGRITPAERVNAPAGSAFEIDFEGETVSAYSGDTVATALLAAGIVTLRTAEDGGARGVVCGIGVCWECRCVIDGRPNVRACMTPARPGMQVRRQRGLEA